MTEPSFDIRPATPNDIETIVDFRARMFLEMGWRDETRLAEVGPLFSAYLHDAFASGACSGWIAEAAGDDGLPTSVGTIVLVWQRVPPTVRNLAGVQAYALGMYVVPERRRRGIARALMTRAIECATEGGAPLVTLHASETGRLLYEQLGFSAAPEMRLFTEHAASSEWTPADDAD